MFAYVLLTLWVFGVNIYANANEGVVEKVKGNKAMVKFDAAPREGERVIVVDEFQQMDIREEKTRERRHSLYWKGKSLTTKSTISTSNANINSESSETELEIDYGYNFGRFEIGAGMSSSQITEASTTGNTTVSISAQVNIIENSKTNYLIPYIRGEVASGRGTMTISGEKINTLLTGISIDAGLLWFPFSEIFAVEVAYTYAQASGVIKTSPELKLEASGSGILLGWRVYF